MIDYNRLYNEHVETLDGWCGCPAYVSDGSRDFNHHLILEAVKLLDRDELAKMIASGYESNHPIVSRPDLRAADAVLWWLESGVL